MINIKQTKEKVEQFFETPIEKCTLKKYGRAFHREHYILTVKFPLQNVEDNSRAQFLLECRLLHIKAGDWEDHNELVSVMKQFMDDEIGKIYRDVKYPYQLEITDANLELDLVEETAEVVFEFTYAVPDSYWENQE